MNGSLRVYLVSAAFAVAVFNLTVLDPASAQNVEFVGSYDSLRQAVNVFVAGDYAYVPVWSLNYGVGIEPFSVYSCDLDGDGDNDLAVANCQSNNVSILRNNGDGTFQAAVNYAVSGYPLSVIACDFDGDGDSDMAVLNSSPGNISIFRNNGDGTFQATGYYGVGYYPRSIVASDLNGDDNTDLAVTAGDSISILINNGDGTFRNRINYGAGSSPASVFAADLDGDGDNDLAVANADSNSISILKNNGDGTFQEAVNYRVDGVGYSTFSVFASDLDGDGDNDLAVVCGASNSVSILMNDGDGAFQAAVNYATGRYPISVFACDLNGDGDKDLAVANEATNTVSVLRNNGNGTFQAAVNYGAGNAPYSVFASDLDGDGDNDLAVANRYSYDISILMNNGDGTFHNGSGIHIIDISDPANPVLAGIYNTPENVDGVFVSGDYAYVADRSSGLQIINIADPTNPALIATYLDTLEVFKNVFVLGDYAYTVGLTGIGSGLLILNVSDAANPFFVGQFKDNDGWYHYASFVDVFVLENYAYVGTYGSNLYFVYDDFLIFDVTDPSNPIYMSAFSPGGYRHAEIHPRIFVSGYGYLAGAYGLSIIDISNPSTPTLRVSYDTPGTAHDVFISGNYAYVADGDSGLQVIDVSDPSNPVLAGSYDTPGSASDIYLSGDYIYVADSSSLQILRFTPTGIEEGGRLPFDFSLSQNYPNPFNAQTTIQYSLPAQSEISIDIYDILGRKLERLVEGVKPAGNYQAIWDAGDQASGIYFYGIKAGEKVETKKMTLVK